jgi:hypothetical protein
MCMMRISTNKHSALRSTRDVQPRSGPDRDLVRPIGLTVTETETEPSILNDSDVGPVLGFSKTIGSVSVSVQEGWTDRSDQVPTDWTDVA